MFSNTWNNIVSWFTDRNERNKIIRNFNNSARDAFVIGQAPTLLKASISRGDAQFKHQFSNWLNSGFRIQAFSGSQLSKAEIMQIGSAILSDNNLIRQLVVLGWDTLEVHGDKMQYGLKWQLKDFVLLS